MTRGALIRDLHVGVKQAWDPSGFGKSGFVTRVAVLYSHTCQPFVGYVRRWLASRMGIPACMTNRALVCDWCLSVVPLGWHPSTCLVASRAIAGCGDVGRNLSDRRSAVVTTGAIGGIGESTVVHASCRQPRAGGVARTARHLGDDVIDGLARLDDVVMAVGTVCWHDANVVKLDPRKR